MSNLLLAVETCGSFCLGEIKGRREGWASREGKLILKGEREMARRSTEWEGDAAFQRDGRRMMEVFVISGEMR